MAKKMAVEETIVRKLASCAAVLFCLLAGLTLPEKPYLTAADADFNGLLPPPPAEGSAAQARELQVVLDMQKAVTPERLVRIEADAEISVYRLVEGIFGTHFTKDRFPVTGNFIDRVNEATGMGVASIKLKYKRLRPFQVSGEVKTPPHIAAEAQSPAYPSQHATFGAQAALLLARMVPEKEAELYARGWEYGKHRIASGVAYPSDWEGGQVGATVMVRLMMEKPQFRADFEAAKSELRKGLGLP
jgi:acid phosphatase (class A)